MGFVIAVHVLICILLIVMILIQAGRGGGLVENFSNVESVFGPKTNTFLTRSTTVLSILFFLTCLSLALLSARQSRSLMQNARRVSVPVQAATKASTQTTPAQQTPAAGEPQAAKTSPAATAETPPAAETTQGTQKQDAPKQAVPQP